MEHRNNKSNQHGRRALADDRVLCELVFDAANPIPILFPENSLYLTPKRNLQDLQHKETDQKTNLSDKVSEFRKIHSTVHTCNVARGFCT